MKECMPIIYALQSGKLKTQDFVDYKPNESRYTYLSRPSYLCLQSTMVETEFDLGWHAIIYKEFGVLLVASKATEATITTVGRDPTYEELKKYIALYENTELESNSIVLTTDIYQEIPEELRKSNIWIHSNTNYTSRFRRNTFPRKKRDPSRPHDHSYYSGPKYYVRHILPVVFIPAETIIEIDSERGSTKENAFKLFPRENSKNAVRSKEFDAFNKPMWIPLTEALMTKRVFQADFVEYVSDKANELIIQDTEKSDFHTLDGWKPLLRSDDKGKLFTQIVSASFDCFKSNVWDDILQENIRCAVFDGCSQSEANVKLLEIYAKLDLSKIKMVIRISDKAMVEINNHDYDGSSPDRAYHLKICNET